MRRRKPVGVATMLDQPSAQPKVVAVCDDGTAWMLEAPYHAWRQLPDIPEIDLTPHLGRA